MLYWIFDSDWATPHSRPRKLISTLRWTTETTSVWETDQETFKYYTNFIWTLSVCLQGDQVHTALKHLDLKNTYVCMLSIDYNPAFNTSLIPNMLIRRGKGEQLSWGSNTTLAAQQHIFYFRKLRGENQCAIRVLLCLFSCTKAEQEAVQRVITTAEQSCQISAPPLQFAVISLYPH